jgi:hypothetical protein
VVTAGGESEKVESVVEVSSVFDQDRSIIFCRFLTLGQSPSFVALKILPRSRRTFSSCRRQATASHRGTSSGPFTPRAAIATSKAKAVIASNLSFGSGGSGASSSKAHPPHVSLLSQPGTRPGIRPVIRRRPVGGPVITLPFPVAFRLAGVRFLGVLFPPRNSALLTVGLPRQPTPSWI